MKKYFFTGFITLLPLALTIVIASWLFDLFTAPLVGITEALIMSCKNKWDLCLTSHHTLVVFLSRVFAFIFLLAIIFILGFFARKFFINFFLRITDKVFSRIPLIRTIYRLSHDITKAVFSENKKTFQETVLVPFPHHDALAIAFVTGNIPNIFKEKVDADVVVFVPTAPHPMSGFVLLTPRKMAVPVDVTVEEAFKFIIYCGTLHPGEQPPASNTP